MKAEIKQKVITHGKQILAIFPNAQEQDTVELCRKLRKMETKTHKLSADWCNGDLNMDQWEAETDRILHKLRELLGDRATVPIVANGDARGYALKIPSGYVREHGLEIATDWGGNGIIAPDFNEW